MKYVYAKKEQINRYLPANVFYRLAIGTLLALIWTILLFGYLANPDTNIGFVIFMIIIPPIVATVLILFAVRTWIATRSAKPRTPYDRIMTDESRPFYSSQCGHCRVLIDYQKADLAFRLWFLKGYVECPCCGKPIRHNKEKNVFIPYRYPQQQN